VIDARTRAVVEANRQLYRDLQAERAKTARLERKVASLTASLTELRRGRDLWRVRAKRRPRTPWTAE
jgi:cell division protein FtsB